MRAPNGIFCPNGHIASGFIGEGMTPFCVQDSCEHFSGGVPNVSHEGFIRAQRKLTEHMLEDLEIETINGRQAIEITPRRWGKLTRWERFKIKVWNFILPPHLRLNEYEYVSNPDMHFTSNAYVASADGTLNAAGSSEDQ